MLKTVEDLEKKKKSKGANLYNGIVYYTLIKAIPYINANRTNFFPRKTNHRGINTIGTVSSYLGKVINGIISFHGKYDKKKH